MVKKKRRRTANRRRTEPDSIMYRLEIGGLTRSQLKRLLDKLPSEAVIQKIKLEKTKKNKTKARRQTNVAAEVEREMKGKVKPGSAWSAHGTIGNAILPTELSQDTIVAGQLVKETELSKKK
jgi:hypothetical protein